MADTYHEKLRAFYQIHEENHRVMRDEPLLPEDPAKSDAAPRPDNAERVDPPVVSPAAP